jgi:hypothetical protein
MSSDSGRVNFNTRELITSTDANTVQDFAHRLAIEAAAGSAQSDSPVGGVLTGLTVTLDSGTRIATVQPGIALVHDSAAVYPDSVYRWIELRAPAQIAIPAGSGGGERRWDILEIQAGTSVGVATNVQIWDPGAEAFNSELKDKQIQPDPVIIIRSGTPAAGVPEMPAGQLLTIPLAYIHVASDGTVGNGTAGRIMCRPILRSDGMAPLSDSYVAGNTITDRAWVQGGGIDIAHFGATTKPRPCQGKFLGYRMGWSVDDQTSIIGVEGFDGGAFPASDVPIYWYAVPPPYPVGYGNIAGQEFEAGNDFGNTIPFSGLQAAFLCHNCILIASETPPSMDSATGSAAGSAALHAAEWTEHGGAFPIVLPRSEWVYLGAYEANVGTASGHEQHSRGGGTVLLGDRGPEWTLLGNGVGSVNMKTVGTGTLPETADQLDLIAVGTVGAGDEAFVDVVDDEIVNLVAPVSKRANFTNTTAGTLEYREPMTLNCQSNSTISVGGTFTTDCRLRVFAYRDAVLSRR